VVIAVSRVIDHGKAPLPGYLLAGAVAGLGFAAKGPVAWICPGLTLVLYLAVTRRLGELLRWQVAAGLAACLALASPWYLLLLGAGRGDMIAEVLFRQNVQRFVNPWDHRAPWWYYLLSFWTDLAPWAFFVPLAVKLPGRDPGSRRLALLSWLWIGGVLAFFSLSRSKRGPYILPIAPAVAVLAAEVALLFMAQRLDSFRRTCFLGIAAGLGGVLAIGGAVILVAARVRLDERTGTAVAIFGLTAAVAGGLAGFDLLRRRTRVAAPLSLAVATFAIYLAAGGVTMPALDAFKSARPFCAELDRLARPDDEVASFAFWKWRAEYRYYLGRPITNLAGIDPLREAWNGPKRVVLLVEAARLGDAREVLGSATPALSGHVGDGSVYVFTNR
jgi:4-amino-4-deoxy-L-arabinose transferase-like glycosyltransferase